MTVSILKTNEDQDFPWFLNVKQNGVSRIADFFETRPNMTTVFRLIDEAEIKL